MQSRSPSLPFSENKHLLRWVDKVADLCKPSSVHWVDGSQQEYDSLCVQMVASGTFTKLSEDLWPGCYYARSDPNDVARVEDRTFICSLSREAAGPTNNWVNPFEMRRIFTEMFASAERPLSRPPRCGYLPVSFCRRPWPRASAIRCHVLS